MFGCPLFKSGVKATDVDRTRDIAVALEQIMRVEVHIFVRSICMLAMLQRTEHRPFGKPKAASLITLLSPKNRKFPLLGLHLAANRRIANRLRRPLIFKLCLVMLAVLAVRALAKCPDASATRI